MVENTEQDWIERARQGEPTAIAELYRHYWRAARATAYGVTADLTQAEDAASEASYAALDGLRGLKDAQRFGPWLHTIVLRTAKRRKTTMPRNYSLGAEILPDDPSKAPSARLEQREFAALIHEAVGNLTADLREAMSLFYFEGYSLKEAAHFLDVPEGTLKRRLHDGRQRLRSAAERILEGRKPMNHRREQILEQLKSAFNQDPNSDAFYQTMKEVLRLRPFPDELLRDLMRKHWAPKIEKAAATPEKDRIMREALSVAYSASDRARDANHPVGAVAVAIRAALPEFQPWQPDLSKLDLSQATKQMFEGKSPSMPPNFVEESLASYVTAMRAWLVQDSDGSVCTTAELIEKKATREEMHAQMSRGNTLSDALRLYWKRPEPMELRVVEDLLGRLSETVVPETPVRFTARDEPHFRAALRMQLADNPIPAATGGVHNAHPLLGSSDEVSVASIMIYLEPWAAAQSGQVVELADFSAFDILEEGML
ncbi:MAG: sigma-70 family RNA polymerase sigma factor [Phycisphaerales bacterium]|nr:MAG: sigma-70 family RNA polymerase sigma factor [Phycisphaerales bacterium]